MDPDNITYERYNAVVLSPASLCMNLKDPLAFDPARVCFLALWPLSPAAGLNTSLNICLIMTFKTITIREDTYRKLLAVKREDESFSDLFDRLVSGSVGALKALRGSVEFETKDEMLREMRKKREEVRYV